MTLSIALAGLFAFLLLATLHWATLHGLRREPHVLVRYVMGTAAIGLVFGAWCWWAGELRPFVAWVVTAAAAGLGTMAGHGLDATTDKDRRIAYLERQVAQLERDRGESTIEERRQPNG